MSLEHITASGRKTGLKRNNKHLIISPPAPHCQGGIVIQNSLHRSGSFNFSMEHIIPGAILLQVVERVGPRENQHRQ